MNKKTQIAVGRVSVSGRRALLLPVIICLLAMLPPVRQAFVWLEFKFTDLLFSQLPVLNTIARQPEPAPPPVLIINKDQTFFSRFQRDPDRADFAALLELLRSSDTAVAAFDFIFASATDPQKDGALASTLASYPFPLLAQHFIGRGTQTFERYDFADAASNRPPWPIPLDDGIAGQAAARGLINVAADLDATVRFAPLAFHPDEMEEFLPTLGFSAWIATLLDRQSEGIKAFAASSQAPAGADATELLAAAIAAGPFSFRSTGHAGIDLMARRLELQLLARLLSFSFPERAPALKTAGDSLPVKTLPVSTWLEMPAQPLPVIGDYHMPCLRLPFYKTPPPLRSDGIETMSMGTLLETEEDKNSPLLNRRNLLDLQPDISNLRVRIGKPTAAPGSASVTGQTRTASGLPVSGAEVLAMFPDTGFWQQSYTDASGAFTVSKLPDGLCTIQVTARNQTGWQRGIAKIETGRPGNASLPLLMFADAAASQLVENPALSDASASIAVFGEPIPLISSDENGKVALQSIPEGFALAAFEEEHSFVLASGTLVTDKGEPAAHQTVAVTPEENIWTLRFFNRQPISTGTTTTVLGGLPCSLDARMAVLSGIATATSQNTIDLTLLPGAPQKVAGCPAPSHENRKGIDLTFSCPGAEPLALTLIDEIGQITSCRSDSEVSVPHGRYLILTELNGLRGLFRNDRIGCRTVFIGSALPSDQDFIVTPINFMDTGFPRIPGVNLHANLFSALSRQSFIRALPFHADRAPVAWPMLQLALTMPFLLLLNLIFIKSGAIWGGLATAAFIAATLVSGIVLFMQQTLMPAVFPAILAGSFGVIRGYLAWAITRRQEQETRQTFGRFISSAVVDEILKTPDSLKPGGEKKELTIIFTDLAGFTTISEKLAPEQLTELMNEYLDEMTRILFKHGGTLDKYIGDAIMGFWNHPAPQPDHPQRAVECAISMQRKLAELRQKWLNQGLPKVEVRAGINTAICMVGFIGSDIQMNFTCLGDGVNLASRLEGANKAYETLMMISDSVHERIDRKLISTRFLDFLAVKGKNKPVEVFEVRGYRADETELWLKAEPGYNEGIKLYLNRCWPEAIAAFKGVLELVPDDGPAKVYIDRCEHFRSEPPPPDWDGRYILKSK